MTSSHFLNTHSSLNCGWLMDGFMHSDLNLLHGHQPQTGLTVMMVDAVVGRGLVD